MQPKNIILHKWEDLVMTTKVIKRIVTLALVATMLVGSTLSVSAACGVPSTAAPCGSTVVVGGETVEIAQIPTTSAVNGKATTTAGFYMATKVNGTAILSSVADIKAGYGLAGDEKPFVKFYNFDAKKSYAANAALAAIAASQNAYMGTAFNLEIGKMSAGKYSLLASNGSDITVTVGIPAAMRVAGARYAVACVRPGGAVSVLADNDASETSVTFVTKGGQAAYAIIRY